MKIELKNIPIREVVADYIDTDENGVYGYGGKLNIRPPYQREFVYGPDARAAVIRSVFGGFPLNTIYWSLNTDGSYELLDGQQRTVSICQFYKSEFSVNINGHNKLFHNLTDDEKEQFLSYPLMVYVCEGSESEKLAWFNVINTKCLPLTPQELLNAVYTGPWLADAKRHFSKRGCMAYDIGKDYISATVDRQGYLEKALEWITGSKKDIEGYMAAHQHDKNADELWHYYEDVLKWVRRYFPVYRAKLMNGLPWGLYYNAHKDDNLDKDKLESDIQRLLKDDEVESKGKKGIYAYLLSGEEKYLSLRKFPEDIAQVVYDEQGGVCPMCGKHFEIGKMQADHIIAWHKGGKTVKENCQMLCAECNWRKGGK